MQRAVDWIKKIKSAVNAVGKKQAGQLLFVQKHISCDHLYLLSNPDRSCEIICFSVKRAGDA